ncbi:uncharacterized protein BDV14DRAFT_195436 [Aspergillus stella-maris]|uniref:uncharacterized protein n=1 Tax=Aspergillus stella-maris TaxID=1810926 RepID=UPI003CCD1C73
MAVHIYTCTSAEDLCRKCREALPSLLSTNHFAPHELLNSRKSYPLILKREFSIEQRSTISAPTKYILEDVIRKIFPERTPRVWEAHIWPEGGGDFFEVWFMIEFPNEMAWMSGDTQPVGARNVLGRGERRVKDIVEELLEDVADVEPGSWTAFVPLPERCMNRQRLAFFGGLVPHINRALVYRPWKC